MIPTRRSLLLAALLLPTALLFKACSQFADSVPCTTGTTMTTQQVRDLFPGHHVLFGDQTYTEVNPAFAPKWHDYMGAVMSLLGMSVKWSEQFDCNRFATVKLAVIYIRFVVDNFHAWRAGTSPAAGELWYIPNAVPGGLYANQGRPGHAIVVTIEGGRKVFRNIYSAGELQLTQAEQDSAYLIKF